jgi:glycosyltransferase involved in cell wall biosynthesis
VPPRVAVVIPCYDDGPLVTGAVASVQEQEPVEICVVDDGSTDPETLETLEALRTRGVTVIRQDNAGPGAARMTGVRATTARFVFPLDADDLLEPGALAAMADALDAVPGAGFAWGDYLLFGDYDGRYRAPREFLPWSLTYVNQYPISSLYRRDALERAGGWADVGYEDWDLWLRFAELGLTGVPVDRVVYRRRLHGTRRLQEDRARHAGRYEAIKARHPDLFGPGRARLRATERPPAWKRAAYPVLFGRRAVVPFRVEAWLQRTMMKRALRL